MYTVKYRAKSPKITRLYTDYYATVIDNKPLEFPAGAKKYPHVGYEFGNQLTAFIMGFMCTHELKTRVEGPVMSFYTNDWSVIQEFESQMLELCDYMKLTTSQLYNIQQLVKHASCHIAHDSSQTNTIIMYDSDMKQWPHRVWLRHRVTYDTVSWLYNNIEKLRVGSTMKHCINSDYESGDRYTSLTGGRYVYLPSEKMLMLFQLVAGNDIRKIENVIVAER